MAYKYVAACIVLAVLSAGAGVGLVWLSGAPLHWGWLAGIPLVVTAMTAVVMVSLEIHIFRPMGEMRRVLRTLQRDGDLSHRVPEQGFAVGATARSFNELMASIQGIVGKVIFSSRLVGNSAGKMISEAKCVVQGSESQVAAAESCVTAVEQMKQGIQFIEQITHQTAANALQSKELSVAGGEITHRLANEIDRIAQSVADSATVIGQLGERSQAISGITDAIRDIADQTNLLALNAAIEAARAGEQGRGFAVVADEVRSLAERTAKATGEITEMIRSIQQDTRTAIASVKSGSDQAHSGADLARQAAASLAEISAGSESTLARVADVAAAIERHRTESDTFAGGVHNLMELVDKNRKVAVGSFEEANRLEHLAENLKEIGNVFKLGAVGEAALATHDRMPALVQESALQIERALERAIASGKIKETDLFDERYQPIPNTRPAKYHTRFDGLADDVFTPIQEALVDRHPELAYAIGTDRNGYVPTHNKRFSKPLTGDEATDLVGNRTKRIFDDPVGKRCGSHQMPFLIQTYRRDTGEIMHDISAPVHVCGKQWGGFRMGYKT